SADERAWLIAGLDRRGIQPILRSLALDPWWMHDQNNWMTVISGGLGVAGMALDGEHPEAARMIAIAVEKMEGYLSIYGPEGEFNESVSYAGANRLPVDFFNLHRYWSGGRDNRLNRAPFPEMCHWVMHTTLPPGRVVSVGDCHPDRAVTAGYVAAVAAASRDGVLQWFYRRYEERTDDPVSLVTYDPTVPEVSPAAAAVPLFKAYGAQGRIVVSRSDWSPVDAACVVHAKAGREENHEHNDIGQLCLDGRGERLIIDPGSPSGYPADFFEDARWEYYNASIRGHNLLMFDGVEQRHPRKQRGAPVDNVSLSGRIVHAEDFPGIGAAWVMDLSPAYAAGQTVRRTVLHLHPGTVAVLDEASLDQSREISLRWHTTDRAEPDPSGAFVVRGQRVCLSARVVRLDAGELAFVRKAQAYRAPYDRDRMGDPLAPRHESYVEASTRGAGCRLLTLFRVHDGPAPAPWVPHAAGWGCGDVTLVIGRNHLELGSPRGMVHAALVSTP
ncbi:MAG: heparinase II/III domain-containing protein, partial [Cephaloticoccus sp.]